MDSLCQFESISLTSIFGNYTKSTRKSERNRLITKFVVILVGLVPIVVGVFSDNFRIKVVKMNIVCAMQKVDQPVDERTWKLAEFFVLPHHQKRAIEKYEIYTQIKPSHSFRSVVVYTRFGFVWYWYWIFVCCSVLLLSWISSGFVSVVCAKMRACIWVSVVLANESSN